MKNRVQYAVLNSGINSITFILNLMLKFVSRSFFISYLGNELLGLNGLYTSILSMLSLAELGISTSIIYSLYEPLVHKRDGQVRSLMNLYKKVYTLIGATVAILGIIIMPFLQLIIKDYTGTENIYYIYVLFLINSVVSYFFTYNRSLLNADQKLYVATMNDFVIQFIVVILQIITITMFKNYQLYLGIAILGTIVGNLNLTRIVKRSYARVLSAECEEIEPRIIQRLKENTVGGFLSKLSGIIVTGTDNILISSFIGLSIVGIYSNYWMIISSLQGLVSQIMNSITSSIGNLGAEGDIAKNRIFYGRYNFIGYTLCFFCTIFLYSLINPFIILWIGKDMLFSDTVSNLLIFNCSIYLYRLPNLIFINAFGVSWMVRHKPIWEMAVNAILSLIFLMVFKIGLIGILVATTLSSLFVVAWWEPYAVHKYILKTSIKNYIISTVQFAIHTGFTVLIISFIQQYINFKGLLSLIIPCIIVGAISITTFWLFFRNKSEFNYLKKLCIKIFMRRSK